MSLFERWGNRGASADSERRAQSWMVTEVLPDSVRYDLQYRSSQAGTKAIRELMVPERNMQRLGLYAALKASDGHEELQLPLLKQLVEINFEVSQLVVDDLAPILEYIEGNDQLVNIKKLADFWGPVAMEHVALLGSNLVRR